MLTAHRAELGFDHLSKPVLRGSLELVLAAGVTDLLAEGAAICPELDSRSWPARRVILGGQALAAVRHVATKRGATVLEPLGRRNVFAMPNFLSMFELARLEPSIIRYADYEPGRAIRPTGQVRLFVHSGPRSRSDFWRFCPA